MAAEAVGGIAVENAIQSHGYKLHCQVEAADGSEMGQKFEVAILVFAVDVVVEGATEAAES